MCLKTQKLINMSTFLKDAYAINIKFDILNTKKNKKVVFLNDSALKIKKTPDNHNNYYIMQTPLLVPKTTMGSYDGWEVCEIAGLFHFISSRP